MDNRKAENWPIMEASAKAIAYALAGQWGAVQVSREPAEWQTWHLRRSGDGLELALDWPTSYGAAKHQPDRLHVSLVWPIDGEGHNVVIRTPYQGVDPTTSITINAGKAPDTIAKEIRRRLIDADATRLHLEACAVVQRRKADKESATQLRDRILAASPGARISANSGPFVIYLGQQSHGYTLRVDGDQSVRFEAFSVPADVAIQVLAALRCKAPEPAEVEA